MLKKIALEVIVFVTGAVIMILELTGSRVMAPYAGTSIIIWTSLIGVILGFLSIGYTLGGKLADRNANFNTLGDILLVSAILTVTINFIRPLGIVLSESLFYDVRLGSVFLAALLFGPASLCLGMVPIYAVRLKIKNLKTSGETVGRLYALSTLGSITGTFLGGFLLIAVLGNKTIILVLSFILLAVSVYSYLQLTGLKKNSLLFVFVIAVLLSFNSNEFGWYKGKEVILDTDSNYSRIIVAQTKETQTGKDILAIYTGRFFYSTGGYQSAVYVDDDQVLPAGYLNYFRLAEQFIPNSDSVLLIGGGAYTFPRDFLSRNPNARMDVIELDPLLTQIAKDHFHLADDARMNIIHADGRAYLNKNNKIYDLIFMDAFSDFSFPWHLITVEAVDHIYNSLEEDGAFVINVISGIEGDSGKTFRAIYSNLNEFFPEVLVFPTGDSRNPTLVQNIVMFALKGEYNSSEMFISSEYKDYLNHLWQREIEKDTPLITDDYAPLDYYYILMSDDLLRKANIDK